VIAVHAPVARLGDAMILSVELWGHAVFVHLTLVENEETDRLLAEQDAAMNAWRKGDPPPEPVRIAIADDLELGDDVGTPYEKRSGQSGGSGTEWRAMWQFEPGVPDGAMRLTISIGDDMLELEL
jgi:hypothetical protein